MEKARGSKLQAKDQSQEIGRQGVVQVAAAVMDDGTKASSGTCISSESEYSINREPI